MLGLTTAIANMVMMSFGYGFHTVIGLIVNAYERINRTEAFVYGISVIPILLVIGTMGCAFLLWQEKNSH